MKVCPQCAFVNEERYPTCIWCNAIITGVKSTPHPDPNHPEHQEKALIAERRAKWSREVRNAVIVYSLANTVVAVFPGLVFAPQALAGHFVSGFLVALAVARGLAGRFIAAFVQGIFCVFLILTFGPITPFTFAMLPGQILFAALFDLWIELIRDANR